MPIIWVGFSVDSSPEVHKRRGKPKELKAFVSDIVAKADPKAPVDRKPELLDLYFEVGAGRACALVKDLDDYVASEAVQRVLGADYATKFLTAEGADEAIKLQRRLVPRPPRKRPPKGPPKRGGS
jgi:hypothetical protein